MKKYLLVLIAVLVVTMAGCSVMYDADDEVETTVSFSVSNSTTLQEEQTTYHATIAAKTTEKETTSTTKSVVATSKVETTANSTTNNQTTTKSTTATRKPTTEKKVTQSPSTTKHTTTTKKVTTTQKQTTTKPKTTDAPYFCNEGGTHHSCRVGPIGWVSSYQKATDAALKYIADHDTSGNFTVEECWYCGKYTASVKLD